MAADAELAAKLAARDRVADFLRAASILVVVVGHWLIAVIHWDGGVIRSGSAVGAVRGLWAATWMLQVMPLFFFVGGFANYVAFQSARRRGEPVGRFVRRRLRRLLVPSLALVAAWAVVQVALHVAEVGTPTGPRLWADVVLLRGVRPPGQTIPFGPLWFLGVYLVVVALSPLTIALHRRFRWWVPGVMLAGAVAVDAAAFVGGLSDLRYLNVVFVLLLPHQLGHFYGDGSAPAWPRRSLVAMAASGLGALVVLTNPWLFRLFGDDRFRWFPGIGHYPRSLLGTGLERVSNAYPPTLCYLAVGLWLIGLALLARPALARWLEREAPWRFTVLVNLRVMTLFLWHMTAYLIAILVSWPLGLGREQEPTLRWWAERPYWVVVPGAILAVLVAAFGRFERQGRGTGRSGEQAQLPRGGSAAIVSTRNA